MPKITEEKGLRAARYFGQEAECNRLSIIEYQDDMANRMGHNSWRSMPTNLHSKCRKAFELGREDERDCQ